MAEFGAHITVTSRDRPSLFDVVAQDGLMATLHPAFTHIFKVLAESSPGKFGWCVRFNHELFVAFNYVIQHHYLKHYGASFAENFYDLKRVEAGAEGQPALTLSGATTQRSLVSLVAFPYLWGQLDRLYQEGRERQSLPQGWHGRLLRLLLRLWPPLHLLWHLMLLTCYVRYLTGKGQYHSPLLLLAGVRLATLDDRDYQVAEDRATQLLRLSNIRSVGEAGQWLLERVGSSLKGSLEVVAFFLQFLDWFYSSPTAPHTLASQPIPPPPTQEEVGSRTGLDPHQCPLCLKTCRQDTALAVSGYVCCYGCVLPYVRREGRCPVTGYPTTTAQLVRIYHQN